MCVHVFEMDQTAYPRQESDDALVLGVVKQHTRRNTGFGHMIRAEGPVGTSECILCTWQSIRCSHRNAPREGTDTVKLAPARIPDIFSEPWELVMLIYTAVYPPIVCRSCERIGWRWGRCHVSNECGLPFLGSSAITAHVGCVGTHGQAAGN